MRRSLGKRAMMSCTCSRSGGGALCRGSRVHWDWLCCFSNSPVLLESIQINYLMTKVLVLSVPSLTVFNTSLIHLIKTHWPVRRYQDLKLEWGELPILMAVSCLSPVRIHILMSAFMRVSIVSGTWSCNLSSMAVAPSSWRFWGKKVLQIWRRKLLYWSRTKCEICSN